MLGAGPVGRALTEHLVEDGQPVRVVTRSGRARLRGEAEQMAADITDPEAAARACNAASIVYSCVGIGYGNWPERWPPMMRGMLAGAEAASARFVFMDNCYMYGPVDGPLVEDLPLTDYGKKPATRAQLTRMWQDAHEDGRVEAAAVRAADFYGPGVENAALGERSIGRLAEGKSAQVLGDPDLPHSFAYVPDIARALVAVGRADDAMGQAWHVPNAPDQSMREVLGLFAAELGRELKVQAMPRFVLSVLSVFNSELREVKEMLYQWERPFIVDASKFGSRFSSEATPFTEGVKATVEARSKR